MDTQSSKVDANKQLSIREAARRLLRFKTSKIILPENYSEEAEGLILELLDIQPGNIIDPEILILMGGTAMEALFGQTLKISKERGKWKELIVNQKTYETILTFHPAYLLRQPEQKKYSWIDLKMIKKRIDELKIKI